jgi:hypothetical protein
LPAKRIELPSSTQMIPYITNALGDRPGGGVVGLKSCAYRAVIAWSLVAKSRP